MSNITEWNFPDCVREATRLVTTVTYLSETMLRENSYDPERDEELGLQDMPLTLGMPSFFRTITASGVTKDGKADLRTITFMETSSPDEYYEVRMRRHNIYTSPDENTWFPDEIAIHIAATKAASEMHFLVDLDSLKKGVLKVTGDKLAAGIST